MKEDDKIAVHFNEPIIEDDSDPDEDLPSNDVISSTKPKRNYRIAEDGSIRVKNLSAYWIPEISVKAKINGTLYTVTGSYEGTDSFLRKLERYAKRKASEAINSNDEKEKT